MIPLHSSSFRSCFFSIVNRIFVVLLAKIQYSRTINLHKLMQNRNEALHLAHESLSVKIHESVSYMKWRTVLWNLQIKRIKWIFLQNFTEYIAYHQYTVCINWKMMLKKKGKNEINRMKRIYWWYICDNNSNVLFSW